MIWIKITPMFLGIFFVAGIAAAHSGESTVDMHPYKHDRKAAPLKDERPAREEDEKNPSDRGGQVDPGSKENIPTPIILPVEDPSPANVVRYWVYTDRGAYMFYDLETAKAFARPGEMIRSEDGTYYRDGEPLLLRCGKTRLSRNEILNAEIDLTNCVGVSPNLHVARGTPSNPGKTKSLKDF